MTQDSVLSLVRGLVIEILEDENLCNEIPLMEAGLDSLATIEFRNMLQSLLNVKVPRLLVFDHPSVSSVVELATDLLSLGDRGVAGLSY